MSDPVKEYGKHCTAVRNVRKWAAKRIAAIVEERDRKLLELERELSPVALFTEAIAAAEARGRERGLEEAASACSTCETKDGCLAVIAALKAKP